MKEKMANITKYGPDNPHPLSTRKTELVWEGKYDEYGNRREVDIAGCAMPMQKIETIDRLSQTGRVLRWKWRYEDKIIKTREE